jgi:hypothetical protein
MKNIQALILIIILVGFSNISHGQYSTQANGGWTEESAWIGNAPPYTLNNNATITVNINNEILAIKDILFNNNGGFDIDGTLIVNGNVTIKNNLDLDVSSTGKFIINGDLNFKNNTSLHLDGEMHVDNIYGQNNNYLTGNGDLYLGGEMVGVNTDGFGGNIIYDPLPIELLSFDAIIDNNSVIITWSTAAEINNDFFTIEKSKDLINWEIASTIDGAGNSNQVLNYEFVDNFIEEGIWYYRLKQTDFDGKYEYFSPVAIEVLFRDELQIIQAHNYNNSIQIHIKTSGKKAKLMIHDMHGRIIEVTEIQNLNYSQIINLSLNSSQTGNLIILTLLDNTDKKSLKYLIK